MNATIQINGKEITVDAESLRKIVHFGVLNLENLKKQETFLPPTERAALTAGKEIEYFIFQHAELFKRKKDEARAEACSNVSTTVNEKSLLLWKCV